MATTTNLSSLVINYLTQAQYDAAAEGGTINENQLYFTPPEQMAAVAKSGSYNDLSNKPTFATVATSGSYNDLSNKPTIPTIPVNNIIGSGTSGSIAKFDGTNSITDGPALGSSTTTYLRNDGTWQEPVPTKIGDGTNYIYAEKSNEINFGGSNNAPSIYIGYRAKDSRPALDTIIFGSGNGTIALKAKSFNGYVITSGTTDLTAGSSALPTGEVYLVYE